MQEIIRHLQDIPLLQGLPEGAIEALATRVTPRQLRTGDVLFRKGDEGNAASVIHRDWVKIVTELDVLQQMLVVNQALSRYNFQQVRDQISQTYGSPVAAILPLTEDLIDLQSSDLIALRWPGHPRSAAVRRVADHLLEMT